jgi:hypothetical protein
MITIAFLMVRSEVEKPSEFLSVLMSLDTRTRSAQPVAGLAYANRLREYWIVEDDPLGTNTISQGRNQSTTARGILVKDQPWNKDAALTLDENSALTYAWDGPARCYGIAPIAKHDLLVCGANGMARSYTPPAAGGTDTFNMIIGEALCTISVTGDVVDLLANFQNSGGV